jgi:hypothetical protein
MSGKNIEVRIAATGGDQAAEEVSKVENAVESMGDASGDASAKVSEIADRMRAQAIAELGTAFQSVAGFVRESAAAFAEADPEISRTLSNAAEGLETMASAATLAAQGFAVGGPLGGAIGAMAGTALPELKSAMDDALKAMTAASEAANNAAAMEAKHQEVLAMGADAYFDLADAAQNYKERSEEVIEQVEKEIAALERRKKLAAADDDFASAVRDSEDAAAIRGGAAPEDVKAERARWNAERKKAEIDLETELANARQRKSATELQEKEKAVEAVSSNPELIRTQEELAARKKAIADAKKERDDARDAYERDRRDFEATRDTNRTRKLTVDVQTSNKTSDLGLEKTARLERERQAEERRKQTEERQRRMEELESREGGLDRNARDASRKFAAAGGRARGDLGRELTDIGKSLANGTDQQEIQELAAQFETATKGMGGSTIAALRQMIDTQQRQAQEIEALRGLIKSERGK